MSWLMFCASIHLQWIGWPSREMCEKALAAFSRYHLSHGIGILDALIGQMGESLDLALYTCNTKHYEGIPELRTLQPYVKP